MLLLWRKLRFAMRNAAENPYNLFIANNPNAGTEDTARGLQCGKPARKYQLTI
jgi:hypothetical protein